jgi:endonuclease G, mitochondrial
MMNLTTEQLLHDWLFARPIQPTASSGVPVSMYYSMKPVEAMMATKRKDSAKKTPDLDTLVNYVRMNASQFLQDPNITSVGVGYKKINGGDTDQLAVQFTVGRKVRPEQVADENSRPIPQYVDVEGMQVPTDVLERTYRPSYQVVDVKEKDERKVRCDPLRPGLSIGNTVTTAGTLGCFVQERSTKRLVMLSNWHVLHGAGASLGADVVQPGRHDDNRVDRNIVGKLLRSHLGAAGDCAIASITARGISNDVIDLNSQILKVGKPEPHDRVVKSGRTSGVTYGIVKRVGVMVSISYDGGVNANVGCFEIGTDPKRPADRILSQGGDSGSAWLAADSLGRNAVMLGLHFASQDSGEGDVALACYADSVMNVLDLEPLTEQLALPAHAETAGEPASGFDGNFLPFTIETPKFDRNVASDLVRVNDDPEIRYCHFSVWLSKSRKYARCAAWNVNGSALKTLKRPSFRVDRRNGLDAYQIDGDFYKNNEIDQGHLARRADVCWGDIEMARQGNSDSCYFTNITPQHAAFNESSNVKGTPEGGLWGQLENTLLDTANPQNLCFSILAGPVFSSTDRRLIQNGEECVVPDEFWKAVAYHDTPSGEERVYAFLLSQAKHLTGIAYVKTLPLESWHWAQINLTDLEQITGLTFPSSLKKRERKLVKPEAVGGRSVKLRIIKDDSDFFV